MKAVPLYAVVILILGALVASIHGSSHSEAPNTAKMPQADNTDFYMFRSYEPNRLDDHFVTFIVNVQGLQNPYAGPNYFSLSDAHFYEIYIDNTGDGVEDKVYQFMYGTRLGGKMIKTTTRPSDFDCNFVPQNITLNGGITLPIGPNNADIAIPLKFAGSILPGNNAALNWFEYYTLTAISGNKDSNVKADFTIATGPSAGDKVFTKPFDNVGEKTFPQYEDYANQYIYDVNVPFCGNNPKFGKVFVGQRTEPFFINLGAIFDLINFVPIPGFPNAITQDYANNDLAQKNIDSFILEVPTPCLTVDGQPNGIIGAWTVIRELIHGPGGSHVPGKQVSRLGNPLINELVIGLYDKYLFNSVGPHNDVANFGKYVLFPTLPAVVNLLFLDAVNSVLGTNLQTIAPATPRIDLLIAFAQGIPGLNEFFTVPSEMLRLNLAIAPTPRASQSSLGVLGLDLAGFPNGRRPGDDVVDIALQVVVAGKLCALNIGCTTSQAPIANVALTDGAPIAATDFQDAFPYLNTPIPGSRNGGKSTLNNSGSNFSSGLTIPSFIAVTVALVVGFMTSFFFFRN